jgi:hypothetical protein
VAGEEFVARFEIGERAEMGAAELGHGDAVRWG